jgi:hypothetical protein
VSCHSKPAIAMESLLKYWEAGWACLFAAVEPLTPSDLGQPYTSETTPPRSSSDQPPDDSLCRSMSDRLSFSRSTLRAKRSGRPWRAPQTSGIGRWGVWRRRGAASRAAPNVKSKRAHEPAHSTAHFNCLSNAARGPLSDWRPQQRNPYQSFKRVRRLVVVLVVSDSQIDKRNFCQVEVVMV